MSTLASSWATAPKEGYARFDYEKTRRTNSQVSLQFGVVQMLGEDSKFVDAHSHTIHNGRIVSKDLAQRVGGEFAATPEMITRKSHLIELTADPPSS